MGYLKFFNCPERTEFAGFQTFLIRYFANFLNGGSGAYL